MSGRVRLRDDFTAVGFRRLAKSCTNPRQIRRLLAIAGVYDGMGRAIISEKAGQIGNFGSLFQKFFTVSIGTAGDYATPLWETVSGKLPLNVRRHSIQFRLRDL